MYVGVPFIDALGSIPFEIGDIADLLLTSIVNPVGFAMVREQCNRYVGFLILHYLYEYAVLFYAGLTSAFEVF